MKNFLFNNGFSTASISFAGKCDNVYLLSIKDKKGKLVFNRAVLTEEKNTASVSVPTRNFKPGIYCLIIRSAECIYDAKVFIGNVCSRKKH
ncbi:MAG: hypothetical protein A2W93_11620 [Bacteroidetes bacterium GWF2_43_63]|nr:MAG: hypothetical protein A2W94_14490 [Bacteroidetes bacterium GWE2_42_42]OFY54918.1 MAG: hypothetical protein A2W93_11620 [Bacteroidetes bacterium GWF2_43_63]HCB63174.1 hypothetical protein [Bacteroidales bacterium]HCY22221.1 hypothetical protein [Bacteroidales bacterium]